MNWKALGVIVAIFTISIVIALAVNYSMLHFGETVTGVWVILIGGAVIYTVLKDNIM